MPNDMSFLPEDYLERRAARRTNLISLTLFAVVIIVVVGAWFVTDQQRREVLSERRAVAQKFEEEAKKLEQLEELQVQKKETRRKAEIAALLIERMQRSVLLAEIINNMPATVSWISFDLNTKTLRRAQPPSTALQRAQQRNAKANTPTDSRPPDTLSEIKLTGVAPTDVQVAEFISSLSQHPVFKDVSLSYSEKSTVQGAELRKFEVTMLVNSEVTAQDLNPARVPRALKLDPMAETIQIDESGRLILPDNPNAVANAPTDSGE